MVFSDFECRIDMRLVVVFESWFVENMHFQVSRGYAQRRKVATSTKPSVLVHLTEEVRLHAQK